MKYQKKWCQVIVVLMFTALLLFYTWIEEAKENAHVEPKVGKIDISGLIIQGDNDTRQFVKKQRYVKESDKTENIIIKKGKMEKSLHIIARQTGVNRKILEKMITQGGKQQILKLQELYFAPIQIESVKTTPLTICEFIVDENGERAKGMHLADIQDGDILITKNSRFLGWRNGHAGLVVDAKKGLVLEAVMLGTDTTLCRLDAWERYPSFLVLRLREEWYEKEEIAEMVTYAKEYMVDVPYHLFAGIRERWKEQYHKKDRSQEGQASQMMDAVLSGTHCAHLVWYAYWLLGIDLDSDGGVLVTPYDIQNSPYLEVIQTYGY